jgi:hypothetical protein
MVILVIVVPQDQQDLQEIKGQQEALDLQVLQAPLGILAQLVPLVIEDQQEIKGQLGQMEILFLVEVLPHLLEQVLLEIFILEPATTPFMVLDLLAGGVENLIGIQA